MGVISLPQSMEQDRLNQVKANSVHVDENFNTLLTAVNRKLEIDGSIVPTADLPMGSHKITGVATPTLSGDATNKGYVDNALLLKANLASPTFTGVPVAPTAANNKWDGQIATTGFVKNVLNAMWPVGAIYLDTTNSGTCPLAAFFGTWQLVATDRALWGGNGWNGNGTISAGLPNITGNIGYSVTLTSATGAFLASYGPSANKWGSGEWGECKTADFDASRSSSIYGASSTVQPPAYVVNVWRRTA